MRFLDKNKYMFSLKSRQSKSGMRIQVKDHNEGLKHEVREMFIGHHTIFSLIGLTIGGTLVGITLWEWLSHTVGLPMTLLIGLAIFIMSGLALHTFDDDRFQSQQDEDALVKALEV